VGRRGGEEDRAIYISICIAEGHVTTHVSISRFPTIIELVLKESREDKVTNYLTYKSFIIRDP
jgi:hypothetical protein